MGQALTVVKSEPLPASGQRGQITPGNVDLYAQPKVKNADGSVSTVDSISIGTDRGEVLIPRVTPDGRHLTSEQAIAEWRKTGRNLGTFKDAASADLYATQLHNDYAAGKYDSQPPKPLTVVKSEPLATAPQTDQQFEDEANRISAGQVGDLMIGAGKGAVHTAIGAGRLIDKVPGVTRMLGAIPADAEAQLGLVPTNTLQRVGMGAEQVGEFLVPGGASERAAAAVTAKLAPGFVNAPRLVQAATKIVPRMATQGATNAGVAKLQGGDAVTAGAISAALPVAGAAAEQLSPFLRGKAESMVRFAIKPTVSSLKKIAGASMEGLDAKANALVRFVVDNGLTSAQKARQLFADTEQQLKQVLAKSTAVTDAPQRAARYLSALENSAAKQGLPVEDVAQIRNAAAELLNGPMGKDVVTMVPTPHPTLVDPQGKPITVLMPQTTRALRTDVSPSEALDSARASSRWSTNKQWGEQKGTTTEATKAVERAQRDATKAAEPAAQPLLQTESKAIQAIGALDRMAQREGNRAQVGLPAHVLAAGGHGVLAVASNLLRNGSLPGGVWLGRLAKAVATNNVRQTAWILSELGVGLDAQQENPAYGH